MTGHVLVTTEVIDDMTFRSIINRRHIAILRPTYSPPPPQQIYGLMVVTGEIVEGFCVKNIFR